MTGPFSFSTGEKDGQGIGGELLKILFENRRGMAKDANVVDGRELEGSQSCFHLLRVECRNFEGNSASSAGVAV